MKKVRKLPILIMAICLAVISFGVYKVFAGLKFDVNITANDTIVNTLDEEIVLTVNMENLPETGLASGQFYVEFDDVFEVETTTNDMLGTVLSESAITYLQGSSSSFSNTVTQTDGKTRINILFENNSSLSDKLIDGELFKIVLTTKDFSDQYTHTISINGEGFSTLQDSSIVDITGVFTNEEIIYRNKDIIINSVSSVSKIYNNTANKLDMSITTTDLSSDNVNDIVFYRANIYGDIYIDGEINSKDGVKLAQYLNGDIVFSELEKRIADLNGDYKVTQHDADLLTQYLAKWASDSRIGTGVDLDTVYLLGDVNLDNTINGEDVDLLESYIADTDTLTEQQLLVADVTEDGEVGSLDVLRLGKYLNQRTDELLKIGKQIEDTNYYYGDANHSGTIEAYDASTMESFIDHIRSVEENTNESFDYSKYPVQRLTMDITGEGKVSEDDLEILSEYLSSFYIYASIGNELSTTQHYIYGDIYIDGVINSKDSILLEQYLSQENTLDEKQQKLADLDADGDIDEEDSILLDNYIAGKNKVNNQIGLIVNEDLNDEFKYGDLNLDTRIDEEDLEVLNNRAVVSNDQSYINAFSGEIYQTVLYDLIRLYINDISVEEYVQTYFSKIGTTNENDILIGDFYNDGVINHKDTMIVEKYIYEKPSTMPEHLVNADANGNGVIDLGDSALLTYYIAHWDAEGVINYYLEYFNKLDTTTPQLVTDLFNYEMPIYDDSNESGINTYIIELTTTEEIDVGNYYAVASSFDGEFSYKSKASSFSVQSKPVNTINFANSKNEVMTEYIVGVGGTIKTNAVAEPLTAYIRDVKYSIKDENIATVDENGIVTGVTAGETILYATSLDGSNIQGQTTIKVLNKVISMDTELKYTQNVPYELKNTLINNLDGGTIETNLTLTNVNTSSLTYIMTETSDNNNQNVVDLVDVEVYTEDSQLKLKIIIPEETYDLDGSYTFKIVDTDGVESNVINFDIHDYMVTTSANIYYEDEPIERLYVIKGDSITLNSVMGPEDATNIDGQWEFEVNDNIEIISESADKVTFEAIKVGETAVTLYSKENRGVFAIASIVVIDPTVTMQSSYVITDTGNEFIDEKFGGTFHNEFVFSDKKEFTKIELYNSAGDKIETSADGNRNYDIIIGRFFTTYVDDIYIRVKENALSAGTYTVKYEYKVNDVKETLKTGSYEIEVKEFIPVTSLEIGNTDITLIKGQSYKIKDITVLEENSTYKALEFSSNNSNIEVDNEGNITAKATGESIVTVSTKDDSNIQKNVNVHVIDYDISSDKHSVNLGDKTIKKINDKLTHNTLMDNITKHSNITTKAFKNDVELKETDYIGTGTVLKTYLNDKVFNEYVMVVSGDIDGNGSVVASDILYLKMHILEKNILDGIKFEAGDINSDTSVNARDILAMKMYILQKTNNVWGE